MLLTLFFSIIIIENVTTFWVDHGSGSGDEDGTKFCRLLDGSFPNPGDCTSFVRCQRGEPDIKSCPKGLLFNPFFFTCDFNKTGYCSDLGDFDSKSVPLQTTDIECTINGPNIYAIASNCSEYYLCDNGIAFRIACPPNLLMNLDKLTCDYKENVKCDHVKYSTAAGNDPLCTCHNCKLPSNETCTKYIECINGKAILEKCPWGQTYDVKRATCDWAHRVDCRHSEVCPGRNGLFMHKDDCRKYVHCWNGIPIIKKCPSNFEFDPNKKRCEWPSGKCSKSSISEEFVVVKTQEQKTGWRCPKDFGYFVHDQYCNKFYQCTYGTPSLKECSEGLLYNPRYQNCDWKQHVRCQSSRRHFSPKKCRVYDKSTTCSSDRNPLPHSQCNMYYDCGTGRACAKRCQVGLYFNITTGMCDLPSNVKCYHPNKNGYSLRDFSQNCLSHNHGHISNPTDAACFYRCRKGKVISGCCSKGYVYNQHSDICGRIINSYRL